MAGNKFFRPGITKVYAVAAVADVNAVTTAEIATGVDLSCDIAELSGFTFKNEGIETPSMCSTLVTSIPGLDKMEDSSLTLYEYRDPANPGAANPLRDLLAKGTKTVIVIFPQGTATGGAPATGDVYDAWPCQASGAPRELGMKDAARWMASLSVTGIPAQDAALV